MQFFKMAAVGAAMTIGTGVQASVQRFVPGTTRLGMTCDLIQKNVEEGKTENPLHPRSIYYKVINRMNLFINKLSTPPAEYLFVTLGNGVLSVENSGTDVVLVRFPDAGKDLTAFGLTPSKIKTIALPNDLQEWPASALNGCTALEEIKSYGDEVENGSLVLTADHGFFNCSKLKSIQFPSSVTSLTSADWTQFFPDSTTSVVLPRSLTVLKRFTFYHSMVSSLNFRNCPKLALLDDHALRGFDSLRTLDVSNCDQLTSFKSAVCLSCSQLRCLVLPPSLTHIGSYTFAAGAPEFGGGAVSGPGPVRVLIWKGRSSRPPINDHTGIHSNAFSKEQSLADLVDAGIITEIFVP